MAMNMAYCRFQNTLAALRECADELSANNDPFADLSDDERAAAEKLLVLCRELADDFEDA